jgi:hypothetical protein
MLATKGRAWSGRCFKRSRGRHSKLQSYEISGLHFPALFGDAEEASALIDNGADVNAKVYVTKLCHLRWKTEQPLTPLACALLLHHGDLVRLLVSKGAKLTEPADKSIVLAITNEAFVHDGSHSFREILKILANARMGRQLSIRSERVHFSSQRRSLVRNGTCPNPGCLWCQRLGKRSTREHTSERCDCQVEIRIQSSGNDTNTSAAPKAGTAHQPQSTWNDLIAYGNTQQSCFGTYSFVPPQSWR